MIKMLLWLSYCIWSCIWNLHYSTWYSFINYVNFNSNCYYFLFLIKVLPGLYLGNFRGMQWMWSYQIQCLPSIMQTRLWSTPESVLWLELGYHKCTWQAELFWCFSSLIYYFHLVLNWEEMTLHFEQLNNFLSTCMTIFWGCQDQGKVKEFCISFISRLPQIIVNISYFCIDNKGNFSLRIILTILMFVGSWPE